MTDDSGMAAWIASVTAEDVMTMLSAAIRDRDWLAMSAAKLPERDCVFCKRIERGEYDYDDRWSVAFQPLNPVTPGHFLVVPRKHVAHALEAPGSAGKALELAGYLANQMGLESANFITSAGIAATQTVFHLHVHIVPRREGDGLALPWTGQMRDA